MIVHLANDLPIVVDLERMPEPGDRLLMCTNVRTVDGKRPAFVNDRHATFIFPIGIIRVIETPAQGSHAREVAGHAPADAAAAAPVAPMPPPLDELADEEPDQDLLARIRSI